MKRIFSLVLMLASFLSCADVSFKANRLLETLTTEATSSGTTAFVVTSDPYQQFTGTLAHTAVLPDATTLSNGWSIEIFNRSTMAVTAEFNDNTTAALIEPNSRLISRLVDNGTSNGVWDFGPESSVQLGSIDRDILPVTDDLYSIGSLTKKIEDIWVSKTVVANAFSGSYTEVSVLGGTTNIGIDDSTYFSFRGAGDQTAILPDATLMQVGRNYWFDIFGGVSDQKLTVQNNGAANIAIIGKSQGVRCYLRDNGSAAGVWGCTTMANWSDRVDANITPSIDNNWDIGSPTLTFKDFHIRDITFHDAGADDYRISASPNDPGLYFESLSNASGGSYHNFSFAGGGDNSADLQLTIYGLGGDFSTADPYEGMFIGYNAFAADAIPEYQIRTAQGGAGTSRRLMLGFAGNRNIVLEDGTSVEFNVGILRRDDVTVGAGSSLTVRGGNSAASTGGDLNLLSGSGSPNGSINIGTSPIAGTINIGGATTDFVIVGRARHADGTEALPSITFDSDSALGFYKKSVDSIGISDGGSDMLTIASGTLDITGTYLIDGTQVLSNQIAGWGSPTGTDTRTTFDTTTVTTEQLAERVKAIIDDMKTHGAFGN